MKKIMTLALLIMAALSFTSCEDQAINATLDGIWEGKIETSYFEKRWYSSNNMVEVRKYQYVDIEFYADPYISRTGTGVEYDYQSLDNSNRCYYIKCNFSYEVRDGKIYIDYSDGSHIVIYKKRLTSSIFDGDFYDYSTNSYIASFTLDKVASHRYKRSSSYYYDDDYYYNDYHYYSNYAGTRSGEPKKIEYIETKSPMCQ